VLVEHILDDTRIDVVTAADDQIFCAAGQPKIPIGIEAAEVAVVDTSLLQARAEIPSASAIKVVLTKRAMTPSRIGLVRRRSSNRARTSSASLKRVVTSRQVSKAK
jgi:hypothetical protein